VIRHTIEGDNQIFLNTYASKCNQENVDLYFRYPVQWKSIAIEANYKFNVEFDEVDFEAVLKKIVVKRSVKNGCDVFTYDLCFEKETSINELYFSSYLNQKEENDQGRKVLVEYSVYLTPIEEYMKS